MTYAWWSEAQAEAQSWLPSDGGAAPLRIAVDSVTSEVKDDPVGSHCIVFNPGQWTGVGLDHAPWHERGRVTRADVFEIADHVKAGGRTARDLFTASYIWGTGRTGYGRHRFDAIIRANKDWLNTSLDMAFRAAVEDPIEAYALLWGGDGDVGSRRARPGSASTCRLRGYGPAFFTKFLYFAHRERALILDQVLARQVHALSDMPHLVTSSGKAMLWSQYRYAVYVSWMQQSAAGLNADGYPGVEPDLLELALFKRGPTHQ